MRIFMIIQQLSILEMVGNINYKKSQMKVLIELSPSRIYLKGDKEVEAIQNYIYNKYSKLLPISDMELRNYACNFMKKYHAKAVIAKIDNKLFYYPKFFTNK